MLSTSFLYHYILCLLKVFCNFFKCHIQHLFLSKMLVNCPSLEFFKHSSILFFFGAMISVHACELDYKLDECKNASSTFNKRTVIINVCHVFKSGLPIRYSLFTRSIPRCLTSQATRR